jgi:hypothetical protein
MRKRFRWSSEKQALVPIEEHRSDDHTMIMPDIEEFVSPVDGSVISSRSRLREHNRKYGVTNTSDYKEEWKKRAQDRADVFTGRADRRGRIEALKEAFEKHRERR